MALNISKVPPKLSFGKDGAVFYLSPYISFHWDALNYFILMAKHCFEEEYSNSLKARNNVYRGNLTESRYVLTWRRENTLVPSFPYKSTKPITGAPFP